jgi:hypothetical protein
MGTPPGTKKPKPKAGPAAGPKPVKRTGSANVTVKPAGTPAGPATPATRGQPPVPGSKRDARREENSRRLTELRLQREAEQRRQTTKKWIGWGSLTAVGVALVAIFIYQVFIVPMSEAPYLRGVPIDGIQCNTLEQTTSHYHAHLAVYVNGQPVQVPTDVGRQASNCFYWLHTHDIAGDSGVIHIEAPANTTFQLHQFFDIWGQPWTATNFMKNTVDATHPLTVYVYTPDNGTLQPDAQGNITVTPPSGLAPYTGDPMKMQLQPHQLIVLEYGTPIVPPQAVSFIGGE